MTSFGGQCSVIAAETLKYYELSAVAALRQAQVRTKRTLQLFTEHFPKLLPLPRIS